jgi:cytidylate kinase
MIVALGGPPGGGKSTAAALYVRRHGGALLSAGEAFRELAKARGLSLQEFGAYAEAHPEVDRELDAMVIRRALSLASRGDVVTEGRLQAVLLHREGAKVLRVLIHAPLDVRAARVAERDRQPVEVARREILAREASERARYRELYGVDPNDPAHYDLVLDSSELSPEAIVAAIRARVLS